CQIAFGVPGTAIPLIRKMLNAMHGLELTEDDVVKIGRNVIEEEVKFNRAAGITESHNKLPEFFLKEPLPPTGYVFDVVEKDDAETLLRLNQR
ncbi:unnamed protein product, partial [marine sediment metagenome]